MRKIRSAQGDQYRSRGGEERRNVAVWAGLVAVGVCLGVGMVGFFVYQGMLRSDFFQITAISINGCRRVAKSRVLELSGVDIRANLLTLAADDARERIEAHDWVAAAVIERHWPNRLEITIIERKPVALLNLASGLHFVDRKGIIFAAALPPEDIDFPVISGVAENAGPDSEGHRMMLAALSFIGYASGGNPILPRQNISELHVDADDGLILLLADRPFPIYLGKDRLKTKYYRLAKVLQWLYTHKKFATTASVRMDYRQDKALVVSALSS